MVKSSFLRGLFDSEGHISDKDRWRIGISQYKEIYLKQNGFAYMNQLKNLVEEFNITCSNVCCIQNSYTRKDGTKTIGFRFTFEKSNFKEFYRNIGFSNEDKKKKLLNALSRP